VTTRQWPGYEPTGIRDHDWMFYPSLSVGGFFSSNVFASSGDQKSDIAGVLNPALRVERLSERNPMTFDAYAKSTKYSHYTGLDQTDARARLKGRLALRESDAILYDFQAAYLHEAVGSLSSPLGAVSPTPYGYTHEDLTYWHHRDRLSFSLGASNENYDFGSTQAQNGSTINEDGRDGSVNKLHSRFDYAFTANFGAFTAIEGNIRDLRGSPTASLSSQGFRSLTGVNFNLTHLISGEVGVRRPLLVDVMDAALEWRGSGEHHGIGVAGDVADKGVGAAGGEVLADFHRDRQIERTSEIERGGKIAGAERLLRNRQDRPRPRTVDAEAVLHAERHGGLQPGALAATDVEQGFRLEDADEIGKDDRRRAKRTAALVVEELR